MFAESVDQLDGASETNAVVDALINWAIGDPWGAPADEHGIRVLKSRSYDDGVKKYPALRLAYNVQTVPRTRDSEKRIIVVLLHVTPYDEAQELLETADDTRPGLRGRKH